jgi:hypothetical protein
MSDFKIKSAGLAVLLMLSGTLGGFGCSRAAISTLPYVPTGYYASIEVQPDELLGAYFEPDWGNAEAAGKAYDNLVFVFKDVTVSQFMLTDTANNVFNIGTIRCQSLLDGAAAKLKPGDKIDVVGTDRGIIADKDGWLLFTECVYLPTGSVNLPAPGAPSFIPSY